MTKKSKYMDSIRQQLLGALIVTLLLTLIAFIDYNESNPIRYFLFQFLYNGFLTVGLWFGNGFLVNWVNISWLEQPIKRLIVTIILTFILTMVIAILCRMIFVWTCCSLTPIWVLKNWDWGFYSAVLAITFFISTFMHGRQFFFQYRTSLLQAERLKQQHLESQYEILKNQVNPHFLFNSLNILHSMVYKDPDQSARFIKKLSDVYRYVLDSREIEVVSLSEEIEALEAYIFLMKTRFGDSLEVEIKIPEKSALQVVPLSLQMLLENAIKHNAFSAEDPLKVNIYQEGSWVWIRNNLRRINEKIASSNIGLKNIESRYQFLSDQGIQVVEEEDYFNVGIPTLSYQ